MRLSVALNGEHQLTASVEGSGYLNAHLNMRNFPKDQDFSKQLRVNAVDTSEPRENLRMNWEKISLSEGDVIEIRILGDGTGDPPTQQTKSSDDPRNLLTQYELAEEVINVIAECEKRLWELTERAQESEPKEEFEKFRRAVGEVIYVHGALLYPIYRRHKKLIPKELEGDLL